MIYKKLVFTIFVLLFALSGMQMARCAGQSNLLPNSNIELGSGGMPSSWTHSGTATFSWAVDKSVSAPHSLKIEMSSTGTYHLQALSLPEELCTLKGRIVLQGYAGDITKVPVTIELTSQGGVTQVFTTDLDSSSNFSVPNIQPGIYDIRIKASHWLSRVINQVDLNGPAKWQQHVTGIDDTAKYCLRAHVYATNVTESSHIVGIEWYSDSGYLGATSIASGTANAWVEVKARNITPPAGTTHAYIILQTYKTGTYYFDDVVFQREDNNLITIDGKFPIGVYNLPQTQLLRQGLIGMEPDGENKGTGDCPPGWSKDISSGTVTQTWDTSRCYSASHSVKTVMSTAGQADWRQYIQGIQPGVSYVIDGWIYATNTTAGSHAMEIQWFNSTTGFINRSTAYSNTANSWQYVATMATAPAGADSAYVLLRTYRIGSYYFDDVNFYKNMSLSGRIADAYNAGVNFICPYADPAYLSAISTYGGGMKAAYSFGTVGTETLMDQPVGKNPTSLINAVADLEQESSLALWLAPDEAALFSMFASYGIANGCNIVRDNDSCYSSAPHYIWFNHAPRGPWYDDSNFAALRPYSAAADIVSMDIYPVPEGSHSSLPNKTLSCVGDYVDILYNDVVSTGGTQRQPIWMVLQGWSWGPSVTVELHWFSDSAYISREVYNLSVAGSWQHVSDSNIRPPAGTTHVYVVCRAYGPGTFYYDDITFSSGGNNLLSNSNIETQPSASNWIAGVGPTGTLTWDTGAYHSSSHSLKTVTTAGDVFQWQQHVTGINPANTYSLSAWINASTTTQPVPTWTETRFMAYDAIINGARGIVYYGGDTDKVTSTLWSDLKRMAGELNSLSNILTSTVSFRTVITSNANMETLLMEYGGNLYLLAANRSNSNLGNVTFTISGLSLTSVTEYFDSIGRSISSNQFTDSFSNYQVHVYRIY